MISGIIKLRPGAVKYSESSGSSAQIFCVKECAPKSLVMTIHKKKILLEPGDQVYVPPKIYYDMTNYAKKDAAFIFYIVLKKHPELID